jgi:hypothetical protein
MFIRASWLAGLTAATLLAGCKPPIQIAVVGIIDPAGQYSNNPRLPLGWALENIEAAGGIDGRQVELVEHELPASVLENDAGSSQVIELANDLAQDDDVVAVLGFNYSWRLASVADLFIHESKVVMSPTSTSGEIYRKWKGSDSIWRVAESDVAQAQMMLVAGVQKLRKHPLKTVALLTSHDTYGTTFFDTFAFFAAELGLGVTDVRRYDQTDGDSGACLAPLAGILDEHTPPQLLYVAATFGSEVDCVVTEMNRRRHAGEPGADTDLFFTDTAASNDLGTRLGELAEGLEGLQLSFDQDSRFDEAFATQYPGETFDSAMGNYYDALMLLAYGLEYAAQEEGDLSDNLAQGLKDAVDGRGDETAWGAAGAMEAMHAIAAGQRPNLTGATGPLLYGSADNAYTDLLFSTYRHWRYEGGLTEAGFFATYEPGTEGDYKENSLFESTAKAQAEVTDGDWVPGVDHGGTKALIVAGSSGQNNYRHQADALAQYDALRSQGLDADAITLVLAGDLPSVRNSLEGADLSAHLDEVDVFLDDIDAPGVLALLTELATAPDDNVYVFLVGHGGRDGFHVGGTQPADSAEDTGLPSTGVLTGEALVSTVRALRTDNRFRLMLIVTEACHGGVLGVAFDEAIDKVPGVLVLTGASPFENSLGTNYDAENEVWLADEFAFLLHQEIATPEPGLTLDELYVERLYPAVRGSHVSIYNAASFGALSSVEVRDFTGPPAD